jgi:hypothetical protein
MAQAVSRRLFTLEARVRSVWGISWAKWHWDRFFSDFFSLPLSLSFRYCCSPIFICGTYCCYKTEIRAEPRNHPKRSALSGAGEHWTENYFRFSVFIEQFCRNCLQPSYWPNFYTLKVHIQICFAITSGRRGSSVRTRKNSNRMIGLARKLSS